MSSSIPKKAKSDPAKASRAKRVARYPLEFSIGAAIRHTHRSFTQQLETHLMPHGIAMGSWYFLRVLWEQDGLTQHELSVRVGTVDATTVQQLRSMETAGLIARRRSATDRRKIHVFLTASGRALRDELEPFVFKVNSHALRGLTEGEIGFLRLVLSRIRDNLDSPLIDSPMTASGTISSNQPQKKLARKIKN